MVSVLKEGLGFRGKMVQQIGDSTDNPQSTEGGLHTGQSMSFTLAKEESHRPSS